MKYRVSAVVTISILTDVEAADPKEAELAALDQPMQEFCFQCSDTDPEEQWVTSGELDGEPKKLRVEELD